MLNSILDVVGTLQVSQRLAYKIIAALNRELEYKGYIIIHGQIPRQYLEQRTRTIHP